MVKKGGKTNHEKSGFALYDNGYWRTGVYHVVYD
jgi:hypothetical protein